MLSDKQIIRYWKKVIKTDTCWEWTAAKDRDGYGIVWLQAGKSLKAHRVSAALSGKDMTKPVVRHMCHNPACVNPAHLETGTQADNVKDMESAGRSNHKGRTPHPVETPLGKFRSIGEAAAAHQVDTTTVRKKVINQTPGWKKLES